MNIYLPDKCYFYSTKLSKIQLESFVTACDGCSKCLETTEPNQQDFEFWALSQLTELWV